MDNGITYQLLVDPKQPTKRKKNMVDPAQLFGGKILKFEEDRSSSPTLLWTQYICF